MLTGRTDTNKRVVFPARDVAPTLRDEAAAHSGSRVGSRVALRAGDYAVVHIDHATRHTLRGRAMARTSLREAASGGFD